ncbi:MAG: antirestriction protein ArdA [Clostridia bacterium]|nr:antirestriction protein ArdA [Clostridia bacterium]
MTIKIYVANLAKYNEGILKGEWIELPMARDELQEAISNLLGTDEECAIHDYEAPFDVGEYEDIFTLNELAQDLEDVNEDEEIVNLIADDVLGVGYNKQELVRVLKDHEYSIACDVWTEQDLALKVDEEMLPFDYSIIKNTGVENYLDWESIGHVMIMDGWVIKNGYGVRVYL